MEISQKIVAFSEYMNFTMTKFIIAKDLQMLKVLTIECIDVNVKKIGIKFNFYELRYYPKVWKIYK